MRGDVKATVGGATVAPEQVFIGGRSLNYRPDIDGLRAVSVIAVILFHIGFLPNGYLGVDVFFVISGFLITGIVRSEIDRGAFTFIGFYERRIRRILPLALVVTAASLAVGIAVMLPDDLENLAQSAVATNLFANNILQAITTRNYWDVVNEFKPLLHTWSLGVEEQFYLFWPLFMVIIATYVRRTEALWVAAIALISVTLYLMPFPEHVKFFHLPFRVFELAAGGLVALCVTRKGAAVPLAHLAIVPLVLILAFGQGLGVRASTIMVVVLTCLLMACQRPDGSIYQKLMECRSVVYVGVISFSLYMWHQPVLAFSRYAIFSEIGAGEAVLLIGVTFVLSAVSYRYIEQPFRRARSTSRRVAMGFVSLLFVATTSVGLWLHFAGGVVRDVPELDIYRASSGKGMHAQYNSRVRAMDREFTTQKMHVLVVGNSFARDWANVLLESDYADRIEVSYIEDPTRIADIQGRMKAADAVFLASFTEGPGLQYGVPEARVFVVGPKNFGKSSGLFFNYRGDDYYNQRAVPDAGILAFNEELARRAGAHYIDMISPLVDHEGTVPVFDSQGRFISQDTRHLTRAGAGFYAEALRDEIAVALGVNVGESP